MYLFVRVFILFLFFGFLGCAPEIDNRLKIIVDADTANEVDDLFAIVSAIKEPNFNLLGINAAQFHTSPLASDSTVIESHKINQRILELMEKTDIPLKVGSNQPMTVRGQSAKSEASQFIINQARALKENDRLHVVVLGPCTNIASAIIDDPDIVDRLSIHYLGFWHEPDSNMYNIKEFNTGNDTLAVEFLLNHPDIDLNVMSATTSQHLVFEKENVDAQLKAKSALGDYLVDRWETYDRWWTKEDSLKTKWIMWDVAIIEALANPSLATKKTFKTPPKNYQRDIEIYTKIKVDSMMQQFWDKF